jgi:asparagine synthase (glutamine-hydrolysing)
MCGLTGILDPGGMDSGAEATVRRMNTSLRHRGPDDEGVWLDGEAGIALGARRLAILDLSPLGHQPMVSASGRFVIAYNGEVYNFSELRKEVERTGAVLRGHSDTEVLLTAIERWGLTAAVRRCAGMFAFALWDREERRLHLVRDRLGEKPLYWSRIGGLVLFGSELKAIRAHPLWKGEIDPGALTLLLRFGYIPAPTSIYRETRKVLPGTVLSFRGNGAAPIETRYWSPRAMAEAGVAEPIRGDEEQLLRAFDHELRRTVREEMVADVPVGAFLSGGIDSSTIVALMQQESPRPVRTFTIGFREQEYDEAHHARAVAHHLGTEHTELYVTPAEARSVIPRLPTVYDEPFADPSQIPTLLVAQLARSQVTVSLSGDGGDELFGGYDRYFWGQQAWRRLRPMPRPLRLALARGMTSLAPHRWDAIAASASTFLPERFRPPGFGDKIHTVAGFMGAKSQEELYRLQMTFWSDPEKIVRGATEPTTALVDPEAWPSFDDPLLRMMYLDLITYLPDDLLVKVDRATMAVSLESRAPFLDHRIVEFVWRIPGAMKANGRGGKLLLRRLLNRFVPSSLTARPKMGFGVPLDDWLRGPLREWAGDLLNEDRLRRDGYLQPGPIRSLWEQHQSGSRNCQYALWGVLMFQTWLDQ